MIKYLFLVSFIYFSQILFSQNSLIDKKLTEWDERTFAEIDEGILALENILMLMQASEPNSSFADIYRRYGSLYKRKGNYDSAIYYYLKAIENSIKTNDFFSTASSYNQIGIIYYSINELKSSSYYFKKAFTEYEKIGKKRGVADAGGNVSEIETKLGNYKQGLKYAMLGIKARRGYIDTSQIGRNYYAIGFVYEKLQNIDSAIKYYTIAIERAEKANDISNITQTLNGLGRTYFSIKEYDLAISYFNKALDTAYKYQNQPLIAETYNYLSLAYEAKGDTLNAYHYLKLQKVLENQLLDSSTVRYITVLETQYRTREKDSTITEQANQIKVGRLWLVIVIIVSISIVVIAFLLIRGYRNRQRMTQKEIDEQRRRVDDLMQKQEVENVNAMLKGQDEERKRIAQELHDRIGSILSTVKLHFTNVETGIALLKEQQNKSYTEAVGLLDEAVDEVRRISHDLYEGSLAKFGFKTALLQLIAAIEKANVVHVTFIDNGVERDAYKEFEQDLYRITQELLSNSLKYAQAKEITIQLNQKQGVVEYMYEDDGAGFNIQKIADSAGIGYKNIAARVAKMGGTWHLDTQPNHGMTLIIELPIDYGKD